MPAVCSCACAHASGRGRPWRMKNHALKRDVLAMSAFLPGRDLGFEAKKSDLIKAKISCM